MDFNLELEAEQALSPHVAFDWLFYHSRNETKT